jgi:histidinol-phosphate aminotransferase
MSRVNKLICQEILNLSAYPVPSAAGMLKLDAMENPYIWPAVAREAWADLLKDVPINRYPDASGQMVKDALREEMGVNDKYDILLGNGSDEIIQMLAMAVAKPGATILAPEPGFVMYKMIATFCGVDYVGVPLTADFELDMPAMLNCINEQQPELIFLAQPNNPTANLYSESQLRELIQASQGLVIMDEAYLPFSSRNHLHFLEEFDNVLVMRTLSKVGLAGLRLGMIFGRSEWLNELDKIRMPYNINVLTQLSAEFALEHYDILIAQCELIKQERSRMDSALSDLGFTCYQSEANFILARVDIKMEGQAKAIFEQLKQHNVLIKCLAGGHPLLDNCLRFTIGTKKENSILLEALADIL